MIGGSHYDTLGLPPDATPAEIRAAYAERAAAFSPGAHASSRQRRAARAAIAALAAAYEALADPRRRAEHDWRLGIDDLQPLDWGGALPEPHGLAAPVAARSNRLPRPWPFALKRHR